MRRALLAAVLISASLGAAAQEAPPAADAIRPPRLIHLPVDWAGIALEPGAGPAEEDDPAAALRRRNEAAEKVFPGIGASPVPVLLPGSETDESDGEAPAPPAAMAGFRLSFFEAGPAGYDAVFELPRDDPAFPARFAGALDIHITGASFVYDLPASVGADPKPVAAALSAFAGLRRIYLQHHMRYLFERHGAQYAVSILCFEGRPGARRLACRDAEPVAIRFLNNLRLTGGTPQHAAAPAQPQIAARPTETSNAFRYRPPGELLAGTGYRRSGGDGDITVYGDIRFPLAAAPALVYSQLFMAGIDCDGGAPGAVTRRRGRPLACPGGNGGRFWRDNFCEARDFSVAQCPAGRGHQGQDIIPAGCPLDGPEAERCTPERMRLAAAASATVIRRPGQESLVLHRHTATERIRFRYLHMAPQELDALGMNSGRRLDQGDPVGTLSNYSRRPGGTSYHLHFDMQVFSRDGWVLVNPYMTLVTAYERLLGARGAMEATPERAIVPAAATPSIKRPPPKRKPPRGKTRSRPRR